MHMIHYLRIIVDYFSTYIGFVSIIVVLYMKVTYTSVFQELKRLVRRNLQNILTILISTSVLVFIVFNNEPLVNNLFFSLGLFTIIINFYFYKFCWAKYYGRH